MNSSFLILQVDGGTMELINMKLKLNLTEAPSTQKISKFQKSLKQKRIIRKCSSQEYLYLHGIHIRFENFQLY